MALFASKPDHPMADIRQAKTYIAELPADAYKAIEEITYWLDSVTREEFKADHRLALIDLLDQAAKNHQRKLSQDYVATERKQKFLETRLWKAVFEFWKALGDAYLRCIEQYQAGAGAIKKDLPVIVARALRALTLQLKWELLRYGPIEDRIWADIGRLYQFADTRYFTTDQIAIYPGAHGASSVQTEFLKAVMLGVSSTDGLVPLRQEIAERVVAHFGGLFTLQPQPGEGCNYFLDLAMREPPARVRKGVTAGPTTRFFGAGRALPALYKLMQDIKQKDGVPSDVYLGGNFETALVLAVLQHLAMYWSDHAPARDSERRKIATRLTVVHGYPEIVAALGAHADAVSLVFDEPDGESWIVENVSDGGYGAIIPQVRGDWICVGAVVGVKTETAKAWGAGVIRRLTRDKFEQRCVGIQLLSKSATAVRLAPAGNVSSLNATREGDQAILLSVAPDKNGEIELLLRVGSFTTGQSLDMSVGGKSYLLMPSKLIEGGDDFDWARFRLMERQ
ncbi:MAG TPA: hypothetical protein VMT94_05690 [Burkholderiales bacterium]|nr:hypothetical protein [Burkholderiales bacterium]